MNPTPGHDERDQAFVTRLRSAYAQHPMHVEPVLPRGRAGLARKRAVRRWLGLGLVVATAAAVPLVANVVTEQQADRGPAVAPPSPSPSVIEATDPARPDRGLPVQSCRASEVTTEIGQPVGFAALDGRPGRLVRLTAARDCRLDQRVDITRIGDASGTSQNETSATALSSQTIFFDDDPRRIGPKRGVAVVVSAADCGRDPVLAPFVTVEVGAEPRDLPGGRCEQLVLDGLFAEGYADLSETTRAGLTAQLLETDVQPGAASSVRVRAANPTRRPITIDCLQAVTLLGASGERGGGCEGGPRGVTVPAGGELETELSLPVGAGARGDHLVVGLRGAAMPTTVVQALDGPDVIIGDPAVEPGVVSALSPPMCRATELEVRAGDDLRLPGDRSGKIVRVTTTRDRECRVDDQVRVDASVGPRTDTSAVQRSSQVALPEDPFTVAPGRDVAFLVSSEQCADQGRPFEGAEPDSIVRLRVEAGVAGTAVADDLGTTGTCGQLNLDWVVQEGFAPTSDAEPYALTGRITAPDGFVVGQQSRIVATVRNPTDTTQPLSPCALRVLPGLGLQIAPRDCVESQIVLEPGETRRLTIRQQPMGSRLVGGSFAFTVDGVAAPVKVVTIERPE